MTNIRNWKNADLKVSDRVEITVRGWVGEISPYSLQVITDAAPGFETAIYFRPVDEIDFEVTDRPTQWTDGDVVQAVPSDILWRRKNGQWHADVNQDSAAYLDNTVDEWLDSRTIRVLRQQSKETDAEW